MRTVGKGVRQVRNASREFKDAIGLDDLMREGDPFRSPPVRPPRARPVPVEEKKETIPPPTPEAAKVASTASAPASAPAAANGDDPAAEPDASTEANS
jgi:hypothetical protein